MTCPLPRGLVFVAFALLTGPSAALSAAAAEGPEPAPFTAYLENLPPLIDHEVFFGDPEIAGAQISPDGKHVTFVKPYGDVMNVWIKKTEEPFDAARPLTADRDRPLTSYFWTHDSRFVLFIQDSGGNENFHIYAVDPQAEAAAETGVPPARDLTPIDGVAARIYGLPRPSPDEIVIGLNDRDPALHDVYRLTISTGERALLARNDDNIVGYTLDLAGNVRLGVRITEDGGSEVLDVTGETPRRIYSCSYEEACGPVRFHKDGKRVYMVSNKGDGVDLTRLILFDPEAHTEVVVHADPDGEVDFGSPLFSDVTNELIGVAYVGDRDRIYALDDTFAARLAFLRSKLPDGELGLSSTTKDEQRGIVSVSSDVDPGSVYLYDFENETVSMLYASRPELPSEHLAEMQAVRYEARDSRMIPAYLTLPKNAPAKNLPAVILPHGGPWSRDTWGYDSFAQFLANRGYVVLQPNFRGSTGYGKAFLNEGNGAWGTGVMQHDLTDGVKYLVDAGIADPNRVAIMGGSYGGYATLAGLAFTPDIYAAGVSIVGPSNIITLLDSIPPYWAPIRKVFAARVGDADDPADRKRMMAQSPLNAADAITAPLLVVQGANDPRVKQSESDQIVATLRDLDRTVAYMVAPDEGHGFRGRENRMAMMVAIERFFAQHLAGRAQTELPTLLTKHLDDLTVDVASVEMPQLPRDLEPARTAPLPAVLASSISPATLHYATTVEAPSMGGTMQLEQTRELALETHDGTPVLRVSTNISGTMGEGSDTFILDRLTLHPIKLNRSQGPMVAVEIDYAPDHISGTLKMGPQEVTLDQDLEAPSFGDEGAFEVVLAALPLDASYTTSLRVFEPFSSRVRALTVTVTGSESLMLNGTSQDAFRIEVEPLDGDPGGGIYWVSVEAPRVMLRSVRELPPITGSGTITTELTDSGM